MDRNQTKTINLSQQLIKLLQFDSLGFIEGKIPKPINKFQWITLFAKLQSLKSLVKQNKLNVQNVIEIVLVTIDRFNSKDNPHIFSLKSKSEFQKFLQIFDSVRTQCMVEQKNFYSKYFKLGTQRPSYTTQQKYNKIKEIQNFDNKKRQTKKQQIIQNTMNITNKIIQNRPLQMKIQHCSNNLIKNYNTISRTISREQLKEPNSIFLTKGFKENNNQLKLQKQSTIIITQKLQQKEKTNNLLMVTPTIKKQTKLTQKRLQPRNQIINQIFISFPQKKEQKKIQSKVRKSISKPLKKEPNKNQHISSFLNQLEQKVDTKIKNKSKIVCIDKPQKKEPKEIRIQMCQLFGDDSENFSSKRKKEQQIIKPKSKTINQFNENTSFKIIENNQRNLAQKTSPLIFLKKMEEEYPQNNTDLGLQCSICCEKITFNTVCPVSCGHILHKPCLNQYFRSKVQVKSFPILCPEQGCYHDIEIQDIQEYIDKDIKDKYFQFSLHIFVDENRQNTSWCPTPGCTMVFQKQKGLQKYKCYSCKKVYCLKCVREFHEGLTCQQAKQIQKLSDNEDKFLKLVETSKYKKCPQCQYWVARIEGCNHMTCRCKFQFCYACGQKYGSCGCN